MSYPFSSPDGDEEDLNQEFAGYLHYSLQIGPELLNAIHTDHPISFSGEARVVAGQDSPLPRYTDGGTDREIDWVISDEGKLVGYESKYGAPLHSNQLWDELAKLRVNADGREVALFVVTMHTTPISLLDQFEDEPVYWLSWFTVFRRLRQLDEADLPPEQRPLRRMLCDLFEAEDMHPFTGFDHHDKQQYRYFIRNLRQEVVDTELENCEEVHTWTTTDPDPPSYRRLVPRYLDVPFVRESRDEDSGTMRASHLTIIIDTEAHDVYAGVVFNLREVGTHREYVADNADNLVDHAADHGLQLWASMNSLNQWELGVAKTTDLAEMRRWLEGGSDNAVQAEGTDYKKAMFVRECSAGEPSALVQEAKEALLEFDEQFLSSDKLFERKTLEDHE